MHPGTRGYRIKNIKFMTSNIQDVKRLGLIENINFGRWVKDKIDEEFQKKCGVGTDMAMLQSRINKLQQEIEKLKANPITIPRTNGTNTRSKNLNQNSIDVDGWFED